MANDYISRDEVLADIRATIESSGCVNHEREIIDCVRYATTADVIPVVRGEWLATGTSPDGGNNYDYTCSNCGHTDTQAISAVVPFCWFCGSRMSEIKGEATHAD
jgi:hypothetical protein